MRVRAQADRIRELIFAVIPALALALTVGSRASWAVEEKSQFLDDYPDLKQHLFKEPGSNIFFGFGVSPASYVRTSYHVAANFFQIHWIPKYLDWEIFSASVGFTFPQSQAFQSRHFTVRTVPKYRIFDFLSVGPVIGAEFVNFPNTRARITKDSYFSPYEQFSSDGIIWGAAASETILLESGRIFKISQVVFKQTYSTLKANRGWDFAFEDQTLEADLDRNSIKPDIVLLLEFSLLF
jgi:hypothetical protein